jgi:hypothetical protein
MIGLVVLVGALLSACAKEEVWIKPLGSGVIVSPPMPLRIVKGQWSVLVILRPPSANIFETERRHLREAARRLDSFLTIQTRCELNHQSRRNICVTWRQFRHIKYQIKILSQEKPKVFQIDPLVRKKRGFIDIVGTGLHHLFGLATDDDIRGVKAAILDTRRTTQHLVHFVERFKTVIDHALKQQSLDRQRIREMSAVIATIRNMTLENYRRQAIADEYVIAVERTTYLTHISAEIDFQELQLQRLMQDLEAGRLTEHLLPRSTLSDILGKYENTYRDGAGLKLTWYYQNVQIKLLMSEEGQYVYRAQLPLIRRDTYLKYDLRSYAVPVNDLGLRKRVSVQPTVGYNTRTGDIFVPKLCMGDDPMVCLPSVLYSDARYACERGLVTGYTEDKLNCPIKETFTNNSLVEILSPVLILATPGEEVSLSCPGDVQQKQRVPIGLYRVKMPSACTLSGNGWTRSVERRPNLIAGRNWTAMKWDEDDNWIQQAISADRDTAQGEPDPLIPTLPSVEDLDKDGEGNLSPAQDEFQDFKTEWDRLNKEINDDNDKYGIDWYDHGRVGHHMSWVAIGLIAAGSVIAIIIAKYLYKRRRAIKFFLGSGDSNKTKKRLDTAKYIAKEENVTIESSSVNIETQK